MNKLAIIARRFNKRGRQSYTWLSLLLYFLLAAVLYRGFTALDYRWRWGRLERYFFYEDGGEWMVGALIQGLFTTLKISLFAGIAAIVLGMVFVAARLSVWRSVRGLGVCYVQIMRCTPLLVQLYLLYFMLGNLFNLPPLAAAILALAFFEGAFAAEIFRAGIIAVPQAQLDAARSVGLSRVGAWRFIVLPQALPLVMPPLANLLVNIIKHSSIVTIIAIPDLTDVARNLVADTFLAFELWLAVGGIYVAICFPPAWLIGRWEKRLRRNR